MPNVPPPDECRTRNDIYIEISTNSSHDAGVRNLFAELSDSQNGISDCRPTDTNMITRDKKAPAVFQQWFRIPDATGFCCLVT
jgi:hypothetical protein